MTDKDYKEKTNQLLSVIPAAVESGKLSPVQVNDGERFSARVGDFSIDLAFSWNSGILMALTRFDSDTEIDRRVIRPTDDDFVVAEKAYAAMRYKAMNAEMVVAEILRELETLK